VKQIRRDCCQTTLAGQKECQVEKPEAWSGMCRNFPISAFYRPLALVTADSPAGLSSERVTIPLKYRLWKRAEANMNSRYVVSRLFFVLAVFCALVGAALFRRDVTGGLTSVDYLSPAFWFTIPRLILFAASVLSACFGVVYFGLEKIFKRPPNISLALVQLVSYLLAVSCHARLALFMWQWQTRIGQRASMHPIPWAGEVATIGYTVCFLAFAVNIFWSLLMVPVVKAKPACVAERANHISH
jgi:hypothetical protein